MAGCLAVLKVEKKDGQKAPMMAAYWAFLIASWMAGYLVGWKDEKRAGQKAPKMVGY